MIVTERARAGLERCRLFLSEKNMPAAIRAGQAISRHLALLEANPHLGRPMIDEPHLRELIIGFGDSGYVALYRFEAEEDAVYLLAFRHQREAGYW